MNFLLSVNSPLLQHLREAGLLNEVSTLLVRAKGRDEGQLRRLQQQANGKIILKLYWKNWAKTDF